eukprot:gene11002-biopygen19846
MATPSSSMCGRWLRRHSSCRAAVMAWAATLHIAGAARDIRCGGLNKYTPGLSSRRNRAVWATRAAAGRSCVFYGVPSPWVPVLGRGERNVGPVLHRRSDILLADAQSAPPSSTRGTDK